MMDLEAVRKTREEVNVHCSTDVQMTQHEKEMGKRTVDVEPIEAEGSEDSTIEQVTYPEGGLQAWLVVFGCFCGVLAGFGFMNTSKYNIDVMISTDKILQLEFFSNTSPPTNSPHILLLPSAGSLAFTSSCPSAAVWSSVQSLTPKAQPTYWPLEEFVL
jgi:hypothetical protein